MPTAIDDLESFLWVLLWALANILERVEGASAAEINATALFMKNVLEKKDPKHTMVKLVIAQNFWISRDAVFGGLIKNWTDIFESASMRVGSYALRVAETPARCSDREEACDELESFCRGVYEAVLTSGYRHLEGISQYSCWKDVIEACITSQASGW
jgi:hypothetical protein